MGEGIITVRRYRLCTAEGSIKCEREDAERVARGTRGAAWVETAAVMLLTVSREVPLGPGNGLLLLPAGTEILGPWERTACDLKNGIHVEPHVGCIMR